MPQEKLKLAFKLLGVSSQISRVLVFLDRVMYTDPFVLYFLVGGVRARDQPAQDDSELDALREQVNKLSSKKAALQEKNKKLSKAKKVSLWHI